MCSRVSWHNSDDEDDDPVEDTFQMAMQFGGKVHEQSQCRLYEDLSPEEKEKRVVFGWWM